MSISNEHSVKKEELTKVSGPVNKMIVDGTAGELTVCK